MTFNPLDAIQRIDGSARTIDALRELAGDIADTANLLAEALTAEPARTLYTCGNGGSAAEALHLAEELTGRYRADRRALPAVCLNSDPTALTCIANDFGFDAVFARQLEALARPNDLLCVFSTSGKSPNILRALEAAAARDVRTIALLGKGGGPALDLAQHAIVVPSDDGAHIQEAHQVILHIFLEAVEATLV
ncbi:MAG: SIS domain-containing protein [Planctomycetota bacterium]